MECARYTHAEEGARANSKRDGYHRKRRRKEQDGAHVRAERDMSESLSGTTKHHLS